MVQINLPKNSEVTKGKYYQDKTSSKNIRKVNVYRWDPSTGENPRIDTYEVDIDNCPSKVLDILNKIKNEIDPTLANVGSISFLILLRISKTFDGQLSISTS